MPSYRVNTHPLPPEWRMADWSCQSNSHFKKALGGLRGAARNYWLPANSSWGTWNSNFPQSIACIGPLIACPPNFLLFFFYVYFLLTLEKRTSSTAGNRKVGGSSPRPCGRHDKVSTGKILNPKFLPVALSLVYTCMNGYRSWWAGCTLHGSTLTGCFDYRKVLQSSPVNIHTSGGAQADHCNGFDKQVTPLTRLDSLWKV